MTRDEFTAASIALLRTAVGWQTRIAERLGCNPRRVREWLGKDETPAWVDEKIRELMGGTDASPWPRDEWIIGDGVTPDGRAREYIMHTAPPRFVARVVECDHDGDIIDPAELPADIGRGTIYRADPATMLCEIAWIDTPNPGEITALLDAAADALAEMTERG